MMDKKYTKKASRSRRKLQKLQENAVRVDISGGEATFQMVQPMATAYTLDGFRPDDVFYEKDLEKPKHNAKTVPRNIEQHFFQEWRTSNSMHDSHFVLNTW